MAPRKRARQMMVMAEHGVNKLYRSDPDMSTIVKLQEFGLAFVGLIFFWASVAKLLSRKLFKITLYSIPYFPAFLVPTTVLGLPVLELGIAVGLILCLDLVKYLAIVLLLAFCLLAIVVLRRNLNVPCNCFGSGDRMFSRWTIAQNVGLMLLIGIGIPAKSPQEPILNVAGAAIVLFGFVSVITLWNNCKMVVQLRRLNAL